MDTTDSVRLEPQASQTPLSMEDLVNRASQVKTKASNTLQANTTVIQTLLESLQSLDVNSQQALSQNTQVQSALEMANSQIEENRRNTAQIALLLQQFLGEIEALFSIHQLDQTSTNVLQQLMNGNFALLHLRDELVRKINTYISLLRGQGSSEQDILKNVEVAVGSLDDQYEKTLQNLPSFEATQDILLQAAVRMTQLQLGILRELSTEIRIVDNKVAFVQ